MFDEIVQPAKFREVYERVQNSDKFFSLSHTKIDVKKRNGTIVPFDISKIMNAISKAYKSIGVEAFDLFKIVSQVLMKLQTFDQEVIDVETIQDIVEDVLIDTNKQVAKAYILYRSQREHIRELNQTLSIDFIDEYISQNDWKVKENSNTSYSLQGLQHYVSTKFAEKYWLRKVYPRSIAELHEQGIFHIHDLGFISSYCVGWSLSDLLLKGFGGVTNKIQSNPPSHLDSALGQLVNFMFTLQGEAAGAQAVSNFDTLLAPFIRYDNLSFAQLKRLMQSFLFNMNVATRVGFQAPFTNITLDLTVPASLEHSPVIIGGKYMDVTYGDFQVEMDLLNQALVEAYLEGDAKKQPFTFPIPTINVTNEILDHPSFNLYLKTASTFGLPYFANFINSDLSIEDTRSMCCRLRLDTRKIRRGGLFASNPLTGSIGVVTLNIPEIAYLSKGKPKEEFYKLLSDIMYQAAISLNIKRKVVEDLTDKNLYPYTKVFLEDVKLKTGKWWSNHFNTIGLVGMNEACVNYLGKDITTDEGHKFAEEVLDFMLAKLDEFTEEFNSLFNLEATPAESTSYRLARLSKQRHPDIYTQGTKVPYFTNSVHPPVSAFSDVVSLINNQKDLQPKFTGGTVIHLWADKEVPPESFKQLLKKTFTKTKIPYLSLTPTYAICPEHGRVGVGEVTKCPICGKKTELWSRVVGYLRPVNQWNDGKQEEFSEREYLL